MSDEFFYVIDERTDILVVDDDPIMREFAGVYLASPAADVTSVGDGESALAALGSRSFDIVMLDVDMPGIDGFEVLARLRADAATVDLPVIVVTGREDVVSIDRAYALGATSFVIKPINWRLIAYQIKYVLRGTRTSQPRAMAREPRAAA